MERLPLSTEQFGLPEDPDADLELLPWDSQGDKQNAMESAQTGEFDFTRKVSQEEGEQSEVIELSSDFLKKEHESLLGTPPPIPSAGSQKESDVPWLESATIDFGESPTGLVPGKVIENKQAYDQIIEEGREIKDTRGDAFLLLRQLGKGAFGSVFEVRDSRTGMIKAIKFLRASVAENQDHVKRFEREIRVLGNLQNPFILVAHDVIQVRVGDEEMTGLVTEFVNGPDLSKEIKVHRQLTPEKAATYAAQIAYALDSLYEVGLVHRDLKPQNVLLQSKPSGDSIVRIGDFGMVGFDFEVSASKSDQDVSTGKQDENLTKPGSFGGTPGYIAPEVMLKEGQSHQSDLYALGVIMYEMVMGKKLFTGNSLVELLVSQIKETPKSLIESGYDVPQWYSDLAMELISSDPDDRPQEAAEVFARIKAGVAEDYPELMSKLPFTMRMVPLGERNQVEEESSEVPDIRRAA